MNSDRYSRLFSEFQSGRLTRIELAEEILAGSDDTRSADLRIDADRARRCGFPEVVFGQGKSIESLQAASDKILESHDEVLITRVDAEQTEFLKKRFSFVRWQPTSGCIRIHRSRPPLSPEEWRSTESDQSTGTVAILSAGTTYSAIACEAEETLTWMKVPNVLIQDVGVAGPYRLLQHLSVIRQATAVVVVAGMEAALASVVGGHVSVPVIAVPTSVGYGANFGGLAALLGMLNSCAANVSVVNIDAGFKAAYIAGLIAVGPTAKRIRPEERIR